MVFGTPAGLPAELRLADLDGTNGVRLHGIREYDYVGASVSCAGDVNGDGIDDVIIGAPLAPWKSYYSGESYVVFGTDDALPATLLLSSLDGTGGFVLNGVSDYDESGGSVSGAGDVNGDGIDDLIVGAAGAGPGAYDDERGESYVVFGTDRGFPASLDLEDLDGVAGFVLTGVDGADGSGVSVSAAGDVNGDGIDDIIIGADGAGPGAAGQSYVVFGRTDTDGDGVQDSVDNCTGVANSDQRDTNADGIGNLCDAADLNDDCFVNFVDLGLMKSVFFTADADADLDGDGAVRFIDLGILKLDFFAPPGPSGIPNVCDGS